MEYDKFKDAALELAEGGARLTAADVARRVRSDTPAAERMLARMVEDGLLDVDLDDDDTSIVYRLKQARKRPGALAALRDAGSSLDAGDVAARVGTAIALGKLRGDGPLAPDKRRKVPLGVLLGGLLPGFGLAYAAPWTIAAAASIVVVVGYKILAIIPIFSGILTASFLALCAVTSAVLGGLYTWQYNQMGKRAPLGDEPVSPRKLLARIKGSTRA